MTYNNDQSWNSLSRMVGAACRQATVALNEWNELFFRWQSFRDGRTDAVMATALGRTEAEVTDLRLAFKALNEIFKYADNGTPTQRDYLDDLRKFV